MNPFKVVRDFEAALAEYTGAPHAVTCTSCTIAITMAVAWHAEKRRRQDAAEGRAMATLLPPISIPKRTYVGVPYAIREGGGRPTFRDEAWIGWYQLQPLPIMDSARWISRGMYRPGWMICLSFHWSKTLGIQQGGAILTDSAEAAAWLKRARFDGRAEGVAPAEDDFPLERAWHAYMAPETAAAGLVRLATLPDKNEPIPADGYPDLSTLKVFQ